MSSINIKLSTQQTEALNSIKTFLKSGDQIFILKGTAGHARERLVINDCALKTRFAPSPPRGAYKILEGNQT